MDMFPRLRCFIMSRYRSRTHTVHCEMKSEFPARFDVIPA